MNDSPDTPDTPNSTAPPRQLQFHPVADLDAEDLKLDWVVEGLVPSGGLAVVGGEPKTGKSILTIDLAAAVAAGQPFLGHAVPRSGPVALLNAEDPKSLVASRVTRVLTARGLDRKTLPMYLIVEPGISLDKPGDLDALRGFVHDNRPRLLIIDCLRRVMAGNENDSSTVARFLGGLRRICREFDCATVVVHHFSKVRHRHPDGRTADRLRGSSDLFASGDAYAFVTQTKPGAQCLEVELRAARVQESIRFRVMGDGDEPLVIDVAPPDERDQELDERVLAALGETGGVGVKELYELVPGRRRNDIDQSRRRLVEQGKARTEVVGRKVVTRRIVLADDPPPPSTPHVASSETIVNQGGSASPQARETMGDDSPSSIVSRPVGDDAMS